MRRLSCRIALSLCAGLAGCTALAACGGGDKAPQARTRMIARTRTAGDHPSAKASATVKDPKALAIYVSAAPKQRVAVVWALSCTDDEGKAAKTSGGTYGTMPPNIHQLDLPDGPTDVCALEATAKSLTGRLKTTLLATAP